jgi:hypothetical protein
MNPPTGFLQNRQIDALMGISETQKSQSFVSAFVVFFSGSDTESTAVVINAENYFFEQDLSNSAARLEDNEPNVP